MGKLVSLSLSFVLGFNTEITMENGIEKAVVFLLNVKNLGKL